MKTYYRSPPFSNKTAYNSNYQISNQAKTILPYDASCNIATEHSIEQCQYDIQCHSLNNCRSIWISISGCIILQPAIKVIAIIEEGCKSGLIGTPGKCVYSRRVPRVRIPDLPLFSTITNSLGLDLMIWNKNRSNIICNFNTLLDS